MRVFIGQMKRKFHLRLGWRRPRVWLPFLAVFYLTASLCLSTSEIKAGRPETQQQWVAPTTEAQRKNPVPATESSLGTGRKIFLQHCAACHGQAGDGDGPAAVDLGINPTKFSDPRLGEQSDGALFWKITTGEKPMPNYGSRLSATDRWNIINYLRTLSKD